MDTSNLSLIFNKIDPAGVYLLTSINTLKFNTLIFFLYHAMPILYVHTSQSMLLLSPLSRHRL